MARIRTIKPEFWSDGTLMECSLNTRLLFIGSWNFADDFGNLDRSAKQLKARVFPADDVDCEPLLQELITHGLLTEYSVNDVIYLHIQGFAKHQVINRPGKPVCPLFDESLIVHRTFTELSLNVLAGREGKGKERSKPVRALNGYFAAFWDHYPRKKNKGQAEKAWISINPDDELSSRIVTAVDQASASSRWAKEGGRFIPYPATWLNAKGWEDELDLEQRIQVDA